MGLLEAAALFRASLHIPFCPYARGKITFSIIEGVRADPWASQRVSHGKLRLVTVPMPIRFEARSKAEPVDTRYELTEAMESIPRSQRRVIEMRLEGHSREDAGKALHITPIEARQLELRGILAMRRRAA